MSVVSQALGADVALASAGGVATANANTASQGLVNDGDTATQGWPVPTTGGTIKVDWGAGNLKNVTAAVAIFANGNAKSFAFNYWTGTGWAALDAACSYTNDIRTSITCIPSVPVSTQAVRLAFTSAAASVFANELQAFEASPPGNNVALAPGGAATANANTASQALVNDGDTATQGWPVPTTGGTIKVDWGAGNLKNITAAVAIFANGNAKSFAFNYWTGSGWAALDAACGYTNDTRTSITCIPSVPVSTQAVRLAFTSAAASVFANELQAYDDSALPPPSGTNVALASNGGLAKASANTTVQGLINDGDTATQGWPVPTTGGTIKVDWGAGNLQNITAAVAFFDNANAKTFSFQYWTGTAWAQLDTCSYTNDTRTQVRCTPATPVATQAVRLSFGSAAASVFANEMQAWSSGPQGGGVTSVLLAVLGDVADSGADGAGILFTTYARRGSDLIAARSPPPMFVLQNGDNSRYSSEPGSATETGLHKFYMDFYDPLGQAGFGRLYDKLIPVPGNHEYRPDPSPTSHQDGKGYFDYFATRFAGPGGIKTLANYRGSGELLGKGWYSFDVNGWHVIALNTNGHPTDGAAGCALIGCDAASEQGQWLANDIATTPSTTPIIAFFHHDCFRANAGNAWQVRAATQYFWSQLAGRADLVLVGHDHYYQRFKPMNAGLAEVASGGTTQLIVGSGGVAFDDVNSAPLHVATRPADVVLAGQSTLAQIGGDAGRGLLWLTLNSDKTYSFDYQKTSDSQEIFDYVHNARSIR